MIPKKKVTEEDLKATEALLASSFKNMKSSLTRIPGDMVKPVTSTVKAHPYATLAAAAGAGLIAYQLIRLMTPRVVTREVHVGPQGEVKEMQAFKPGFSDHGLCGTVRYQLPPARDHPFSCPAH